ncbi:unnamed protein product [Prorocentrum cordatum]|uniref:DUF676 domain-containing protein n=1 Tax=Prorocentrum cordatum TaxID=2364126 RepID=A0ABN9VQE0_9DINO|nr:unnamed protein product [Polarella glacialis]
METAVPVAGRVLCVMVHGLGGTARDWDTWVEVLSSRFPSWSLKPLETLAGGARVMGRAVDALASEAADEIAGAVNAQLAMLESPSERLTLHAIGHSMGGIILRGALPKLVDEVGVERVRLGHYMSLSSPHLGVQAPWSTLRHAWKNLSRLTQPVSLQLAQLSVQDASGSRGRPYLVALGDPAGPHLALLRRFRTRTCATMARGDALIPLASGLIEPEHRQYQWHAFADLRGLLLAVRGRVGARRRRQPIERERARGAPFEGAPFEGVLARPRLGARGRRARRLLQLFRRPRPGLGRERQEAGRQGRPRGRPHAAPAGDDGGARLPRRRLRACGVRRRCPRPGRGRGQRVWRPHASGDLRLPVQHGRPAFAVTGCEAAGRAATVAVLGVWGVPLPQPGLPRAGRAAVAQS